MTTATTYLSDRYGKPDMERLETAQAAGAYAQARRIVAEMSPDDVIETMKKSQLRGLGGAGFPAGVKWGFVPKDESKPHYLIVNADEGEPGTCKDRYILTRCPHTMFEGCIIAAHAIRARRCYIYVRGEYVRPIEILEQAIAEARAAGILGPNHLGTGREFDIVVHPGAGAYICGEESALIESIEGKKGQPRNKPPFPAIEGLFNCPTVVNNVETLSYVPHVFDIGPEAFAAMGNNGSGGTRLMCVSGHVERPGVFELPMGTPLTAMINDHAGGVWKGRKLKAVIPGGMSSPILTPDEIAEARHDFDSLQGAGTMAGSAGLIVLDDQTPMIDVLLNCSHFYHEESCGQCTPCREGTWWLHRIILRVAQGRGRVRDLDEIVRICGNIEGRTVCAFGEAAAWPIRSHVVKFRDELEAFIKSGATASEAAFYGAAAGAA